MFYVKAEDRSLYVANIDAGETRELATMPERGGIATINDDPDFLHPGFFRAERLVDMSRHHNHLEPNVSFTPDSKMVIFRSNMFGPTYVFGVEVEKAK